MYGKLVLKYASTGLSLQLPVAVSLLFPSALWLLLLLPIIVILHFVRQRKKQREVSALFLWNEAKVLARRRRRVSPTLLLLLQLLFAGLLVLALAQPRLVTPGAPPQVFVFDASASMAARGPDGTRLAQAVAEAEALLSRAGRVAVVRAGLGARVVQPLTGDHAAVEAALRALRAADADASLDDALALARSLAPTAQLHLFSDQAAPGGWDEVALHPLGSAAPNLGISAFELAYGQLFASLTNNGDAPREVTLVVEETAADGNESPVREVFREVVRVPAAGQANTSLPLTSDGGLYRARLEGLSGSALEGDALALDNEAFAGTRALNVELLGNVPVLERVLRALPGVALGAAPATVTVQVGQAPRALPKGDVVLFNQEVADPVYSEVADWNRTDPLLRFVDLTGVVVAASADPLPLPLAQATVLARTTDLTPVLLRWQDAGREIVLFRFNPVQSDLSRRPAFPILLANLFEAFRSEATVPLGTALGPDTYLSEPGRVTLEGRTYTTSPLPVAESRLEVTATPRQVAVSSGSSEAERNPAPWLLLGALLLLLGEWFLWSQGRARKRLSWVQRPR